MYVNLYIVFQIKILIRSISSCDTPTSGCLNEDRETMVGTRDLLPSLACVFMAKRERYNMKHIFMFLKTSYYANIIFRIRQF